jgi:hypothetical protein
MVAALPPDTAGHVLCQALSQQRWDAVLGGTTLREVQSGGCHVVTAALDVTLHLDAAPVALQDPESVDVAGRDGEVEYLAPKSNARLSVRLVSANPTDQIKPFLRVEISRATGHSGPPVDELAGSVATQVVKATTAPGPSLPEQGRDQAIAARQEPPVPDHGIVDSPWPMISWQLCTTLGHELGATGKPRFDGRCTVRNIQAAYTDDVSPRLFPDTLAGRPALISNDIVAIKLTDDSTQELTFTGTGRPLKALAEAVLPQLLGR